MPCEVIITVRRTSACYAEAGCAHVSGTWDLEKYGPVYALAGGPYGAVLALSWNRDKEGQPSHVVWLDESQGDHIERLENAIFHT